METEKGGILIMEQKILIPIKASEELPDKAGYYIACNDKGFIDSFGHDIIDTSFYWWLKPVSIDELFPNKNDEWNIANKIFDKEYKTEQSMETWQSFLNGFKLAINYIKSKLIEK